MVPAERLMEEAQTLAAEIASNPPLAVRSTKQLLISHMPDLDRIARQEYAANGQSKGSQDRKGSGYGLHREASAGVPGQVTPPGWIASPIGLDND